MKKNVLRKISIVLAALFALSTAACSGQGSTPTATPKPTQTATQAPGNTTQTPEPVTDVYPLNSNKTLKYWCESQSNYNSYVSNWGDTEFAKEWQKRLGVKLEFIQPVSNSTEVFSVMVASRDLPDIIEWNWVTGYPGGSTAAMEDGVILRLNEPMEQWAPNYMNFLAENPNIEKQVKTDNGDLFCFPFLRAADKLKITSGLMLRKDWLDKLGITELPETIAEWDVVLSRFVNEIGAKYGYTAQASASLDGLHNGWLGAYGVRTDTYVDGNTVKYGFAEPGYKEFLIQMNDWYNKKIIDQNGFLTTDRPTLDASMTSPDNICGVAYQAGGGAMGPWITTGKTHNPDYDLVAAKFPVLTKGAKNSHSGGSTDFATGSRGMAAITTKAQDVELCTRVLDYVWSPEGHIFVNFGTEGVSYTMVNGIPTYTDLILKPTDGKSIAQSMANHIRGNMNGPFNQDEQYIIQYYTMPQQKDALDKWTAGDNPSSTLMPTVSLTAAESSEAAQIKTTLDTYVKEQGAMFITGALTFDKYDAFLKELERMNYKRLVEIYQTAVDRYNQR